MKPILAAVAAVLITSGAALAQSTTIQAAPPTNDTGSQGYQAQGTQSPSTPTPAPTHHSKKHHTAKHHTTKHHHTSTPQ